MIRPVHKQRQKKHIEATSKQTQHHKKNQTKRPNIYTKQQRARETSKFKIQDTSQLSVRKPYAQNKGQHLDKDANRQRPPQEKKTETTRPGETSKFKNKETSVLSPEKHNTKPQHPIETQTDTEPQ